MVFQIICFFQLDRTGKLFMIASKNIFANIIEITDNYYYLRENSCIHIDICNFLFNYKFPFPRFVINASVYRQECYLSELTIMTITYDDTDCTVHKYVVLTVCMLFILSLTHLEFENFIWGCCVGFFVFLVQTADSFSGDCLLLYIIVSSPSKYPWSLLCKCLDTSI